MTSVALPAVKIAYLVELVLLATPVLVVLGVLAAIGTIYCGIATLIGISMFLDDAGVAKDIDETLRFLLLAPIGTALCVSGLVAVRLFVRLSRVYLLGSTEELATRARDFCKGTLLAAAPLTVVVGFIALNPDATLLPIVAGGAVALLIPIGHLGIALLHARRSQV